MALSNTSITLNQVKTETGLTSNDLSTLILSASVNKWGFNTPLIPYADYQSKFWGVTTPASPYPLGAFLGYDHQWRCYAFDTKPTLSVNEDDILENITVGFYYFPAWSEEPVGSMTHYFNVEWNTTNNWDPEDSPTTIYTNYPVVNGEDLILPDLYTGSRGLAPDNTTTLVAGGGCYYRISYSNSSQDRRWDRFKSMNGGDPPGEMIFQVSIGASEWGKFAEIDDIGTFSAYDDGGVNRAILIFRAELSLVWYPATEIEVTAEVDTDPEFGSEDKQTMIQTIYFAEDFTIPRPNEVFSMLLDSFPFITGDTIYARMKISNVPEGIINLSSEWVDLGSTEILDYLP